MNQEELKNALRNGGYSEQDIELSQKITHRALESHLALTYNVRTCKDCSLRNTCKVSPIIGTGPWNSPLMIVGDYPEDIDSAYQTPFIGPEGHLLGMILAKAKVDRNALYMTYALKCRPVSTPTEIEMSACRRHILDEIEAVNPRVILTFGETAMRVVSGDYTLSLNNQHSKLHTQTFQTATSTKSINVVHSYPLHLLLKRDEHQAAFKGAVWNDIQIALKEVMERKPEYTYDRIGLDRL